MNMQYNWVQAGHQVTVLTGAPNFPEGKLFPGYQNRWYAVEMMEGIRVVRVKTYITANEGFLKRTLDYLSFMVMAVIAGLFQKRPDIIIATSPQFFATVGGWMLAKLRCRPFIFELRDLWPASIAAVGAMKNRRLLQWLEKLELFLYHQATAIVALTNAFKADLTRRGIPASKISVVINGVELSRYAPQAKDLELVKQYDLTDKFVVGYIGTHGMAHALHRVLETAELLRYRQEMVFLFVGSGATREQLVQEAKLKNLTNVRFIPRQPKDLMPRLWSLCDIALIPLKNDSLFDSVIPSKIFEAMGMGIPLLLSIPEGEATQIIRDTGAGVIVPPEQPLLLAEAIITLYNQPSRVAELTRASQQAASNFSRGRQAEKMLEVFEGVLSHSGVQDYPK